MPYIIQHVDGGLLGLPGEVGAFHAVVGFPRRQKLLVVGEEALVVGVVVEEEVGAEEHQSALGSPGELKVV